jgi:hypothetical protein
MRKLNNKGLEITKTQKRLLSCSSGRLSNRDRRLNAELSRQLTVKQLRLNNPLEDYRDLGGSHKRHNSQISYLEFPTRYRMGNVHLFFSDIKIDKEQMNSNMINSTENNPEEEKKVDMNELFNLRKRKSFSFLSLFSFLRPFSFLSVKPSCIL